MRQKKPIKEVTRFLPYLIEQAKKKGLGCRNFNLINKLRLMNIKFFSWIDKLFTEFDKGHIRRTKNIRLIPDFKNRRGGKLAYGEWAHVIGIFQTIIYQTLSKKTGNSILDVGCGTGLLGISSEPFVSGGGVYTGIDVMQADIAYCQAHYKLDNYRFIHLDVANPTYAKSQPSQLKVWPVEDESKDLVTALSVWTHLNEVDATFYIKEIGRVLKKGGKAIITFFYLNQEYKDSLPGRTDDIGRFHNTNQKNWIFNVPAYDSKNWFTIPSVSVAEDAIGVTEEGIKILIENSGLKLIKYYPGNWKEAPGIFFQDILIFEK